METTFRSEPLQISIKDKFQQECIPVGCVLPVSVATTRCQYRGSVPSRGWSVKRREVKRNLPKLISTTCWLLDDVHPGVSLLYLPLVWIRTDGRSKGLLDSCRWVRNASVICFYTRFSIHVAALRNDLFAQEEAFTQGSWIRLLYLTFWDVVLNFCRVSGN